MKNLVIANVLNFGVFFFFLINPNNIFSANIVNWVSWITGILNVIFFVLVIDSVVKRTKKIISLQNNIIAFEKENEGLYNDLDQAEKELILFKACYENRELEYEDLFLKNKELAEENKELKKSIYEPQIGALK